MKNWLTPLLLALSLFAATGCTNTSEIIATGLKIELTQIERGSDGVTHVTWRMNNPNIVPYLLDSSIHKITLDGAPLGTIKDESRMGLAPHSQTDRTNVLVPANAAAAERLTQLAAKGSASYEGEFRHCSAALRRRNLEGDARRLGQRSRHRQ